MIRRFKKVAQKELTEPVQLPKAIAIDEYKGDTDVGTHQFIIANADTHEPIDSLPNRRKSTIKKYLQQYGQDVQIVVMDMNPGFKRAVQEALNKPIIVANRFHDCRSIYWAMDEVRRKVQLEWEIYDWKKCKRKRDVFYKREAILSEKQRWYLIRYTEKSSVLKKAYELKELYCTWFDWAKTTTDIPAFSKAIRTLKNGQVEILNSFSFGYSNSFLEGINNKTKVLKRNAFGLRRFDHFRVRILLNRK